MRTHSFCQNVYVQTFDSLRPYHVGHVYSEEVSVFGIFKFGHPNSFTVRCVRLNRKTINVSWNIDISFFWGFFFKKFPRTHTSSSKILWSIYLFNIRGPRSKSRMPMILFSLKVCRTIMFLDQSVRNPPAEFVAGISMNESPRKSISSIWFWDILFSLVSCIWITMFLENCLLYMISRIATKQLIEVIPRTFKLNKSNSTVSICWGILPLWQPSS